MRLGRLCGCGLGNTPGFGCDDNNFWRFLEGLSGGGGGGAHHRWTVLGPSAAEVVYAKQELPHRHQSAIITLPT